MRSKYADLGRQLISIVCVAMALDILVNCINWVRRNGEGCTAPLAVGHLPRLLCWVNGSGNRTDLIQETWGRRCDVLIFTSSRSAESWKDVHDKHLNEADWFFKTSDDTYLVVEHMKDFLSTVDTQLPLRLGLPHSYVISRESLRRIARHREASSCPNCLEETGVEQTDTKDDQGCHRFVPSALVDFLDKADTCSSSRAFVFSEVKDFQLQVYEFLIYHLKVMNFNDPNLPRLPTPAYNDEML